jgi:hypothetical protein
MKKPLAAFTRIRCLMAMPLMDRRWLKHKIIPTPQPHPASLLHASQTPPDAPCIIVTKHTPASNFLRPKLPTALSLRTSTVSASQPRSPVSLYTVALSPRNITKTKCTSVTSKSTSLSSINGLQRSNRISWSSG